MINNKLFEKIKNSKSKILVVTKYWDIKKTDKIIDQINKNYPETVFGFWENRIKDLIVKNIDRKDMHFIWNLQSKKIEEIITFCSTIHSLSTLKHAKLINKYSKELAVKTKVFLQINLDPLKSVWLTKAELSDLIENLENLKNIKILWLSGMWAWIFTVEEKQKEFDLLKNLRDKHLPWKMISAWTSRDYEFALKNEIEVVRIWKKILEDK